NPTAESSSSANSSAIRPTRFKMAKRRSASTWIRKKTKSSNSSTTAIRHFHTQRRWNNRDAQVKRLTQFFDRVSLVLLFLFLLAAPSYSAEKARLTLGYSTTGPTAVGLWMAKEIGAFDKHGVDPSLIFISSSPVLVPALIGGDLQGGIAGANAVISAVLGGAVLATLRTDAPYRILVDLAEFGIQYSMALLVVSRDFYRRSPETLENIMRAYIEGVVALREQKQTALKTIARYTRLKEAKPIEEIYSDAAKY